MKKLLTIFTAMAIIISVGAMVQAQTIEDRAEYRPSTDIYFDIATGQLLGSVYPIPALVEQEFHLNVVYGAPWTDAEIDTFNDRANLDGPLGLAFGDPESYYLDMPDDDAAIIEYLDHETGTEIIGSADWTITGKWGDSHHTILSGIMTDNALAIYPRVYRSYDQVNEVEVFEGALLPSEVVSYTFTDLGNGIGLLSAEYGVSSAWSVASVVGTTNKDISNTLNYLFILMVPAGAVLIWKGLRRKK